MTTGRYEDKDGGGSKTTTANDLVSSNVQVDVGKKTRTGTAASGPQTGIPIVDNPPACADHPTDGADCFLTPERRGFLVSEFVGQVNRTAATYGVACSMVEMEVLLDKGEGAGPLVSFIISTLTGFILGKLGQAVVTMKESVKVDLGNTGWSGAAKAAADKVAAPVALGPSVNPGPSLRDRALLAVEHFDKTKLEMKIESIIDKAKEAPKKAAEKAVQVEVKTKQQESMNYLEIVRAVGERAFNNIRREMLAGATDAEIVTYTKLFDLEGKMTTDFVEAIREKLKRYLASDVRNIGRHSGVELSPNAPKREPIVGSKEKNLDTKVRWQRNVSGYPFKNGLDRRLAYVHQEAYADPHAPSTGAVQKGSGSANNQTEVAPELWDVAVAKHKAAWGVEPEVDFIDDSDSDDAKQSMAAKTQKANIARSQLLADHANAISQENVHGMEKQKRDAMKAKPLVDLSTPMDADQE